MLYKLGNGIVRGHLNNGSRPPLIFATVLYLIKESDIYRTLGPYVQINHTTASCDPTYCILANAVNSCSHQMHNILHKYWSAKGRLGVNCWLKVQKTKRNQEPKLWMGRF